MKLLPAHPARVLLLLAMVCTVLAAAATGATAAPAASEAAASKPTAAKRQAPTVAQAEAAAEAKREADAKRRAEDSEFERQALDQSAFAEDGDKAEKASSGGGSLVRLFLGLGVVVAAIYGVHWLLKKWAQSKLDGPVGAAGLIDVVSTTALSQGRSLHLVRVADELVLVGSTEHSITRLGQLDARTLVGDVDGTFALPSATRRALPAASGSTAGAPLHFHDLLEGSLANGGSVGDAAVVGPMTEGPLLKRFIHNLRVSTAR